MTHDRYPHLVWEGRFQPVHRGHLAYVGELLRHADQVTVVVVANETSTHSAVPSPVPQFSAIVDGHHAAERNPWPLWLRQRMVQSAVRAAHPGRAADVTVLGGHRLDLDWPLYRQLLPADRVFAVPARDDFEDAKARAWTALGERVVRLDVGHLPRISGTQVRELMASGDALDEVLHPVTLAALRESGCLAGAVA
ncbi:adenylyltransferase/cytidyltransferase family protein [Actinocrinis puniceicyclus]|uniref:Adenylyltransferase/cytidyltransferase family protein n=1 Tax=Actinocrinis puniceicyclus TaxID=977794 RepID=A0A8J8BFJ9_9ACTN|nr:adenylyltransferase/cytidyltransferase family protein [Actinocrinis puniceicyclus]MBS2964824.1 adenylyltransferase/cytidyltransferase family protein [Actinocrinis puniceicyclus]